MSSKLELAEKNGLGLIVPIVVLACGHMLSNLIRTVPAVSLDLISTDLKVNAATVGSLAGAYHFAFAAGQIPLGVALDRFSVRTVSIVLLLATLIGSVFAALGRTPIEFALAQIVLGLATSGMLLCPMTYAARRMSPAKFGLWTGMILSLGNCGMILSASPLALLVDRFGWRGGFWFAAVMAAAIVFAVVVIVRNDEGTAPQKPRHLLDEAWGVFRQGFSRKLRGVVVLAFFSLAVSLILRGVWGGPWLMDIKGLSRLQASQSLLVLTLSLIVGPVLLGVLDRRFGHRRTVIIVSHILCALTLAAMACGGPNGLLSNALGIPYLSAGVDTVMLAAIGLFGAAQPLLYAITREVVAGEDTGKALSAVNLSFFLGTAVLQAITGVIVAASNLPTALLALAAGLLLGVAAFAVFTNRREAT